jgi:NADP-dependent 3-hydroxy acid dehydrogenase YdfG
MARLAGKVAFITGGGGGIGRKSMFHVATQPPNLHERVPKTRVEMLISSTVTSARSQWSKPPSRKRLSGSEN